MRAVLFCLETSLDWGVRWEGAGKISHPVFPMGIALSHDGPTFGLWAERRRAVGSFYN